MELKWQSLFTHPPHSREEAAEWNEDVCREVQRSKRSPARRFSTYRILRVQLKRFAPNLLECGRVLGRDAWLQAARTQVVQRTQAWEQAGADASPQYWFRSLAVGGVELGLFKGLAGWPYLRARLADPQRVPCALLPGVGLF